MAVTVLTMLKEIAAMKGRKDLTADEEDNALYFINEAVLLTMGMLSQAWLGDNLRSAGAIGKLKLVTATDDVDTTTSLPSTLTVFIPFPDSGDEPICYISNVFISIDSGAFYRARQTSLAGIYGHVPGTNYAVTATEPLFAYTDGGIQVTPGGTSAVQARYNYVKRPIGSSSATFPLTSADNFPLDDDLVPTVLNYADSAMAIQSTQPNSVDKGTYLMNNFLNEMQRILGLAANQPERPR